MRKQRREQPKLEPLEAKTLLSATGSASIDVPPVHVRIHGPRHPVALQGQITGTATASTPNPDVGATQSLRGAGHVSPLGDVEARGSLQLLGFIARGRATGSLTLSHGSNSVTLALTGPLQPGFSTAPSTFSYVIEGGTGKFKNASGHGTVTLQERPLPEPAGGSAIASPLGHAVYSITMMFRAAHS